jgi:uncharacterized Zn finger protein (UPF0148 family)
VLAAHCPSCGSPAPVSLATPDWISCPSCRYGGAPDPEVSAQLRDAANALWAMNEGDRQLSQAQRYNLRASRSNLFVLGVVLLIIMVPLLGMAGSCSVLAVSGQGFEPMALVLFLAGCLPFVVGICASILALRHVRNRGKELAVRCLALAPENAGEPARCHVCGGALEVSSKQGVVRCGFCRADNLVSKDALARMTARRRLEVGKIGEQVRAEGRALDDSALAAGLVAFVVAVLSPIVSVVFVFAAILIGSEIELEVRDDATYTLVRVTNVSCIAEVGTELDFHESVIGFENRPLPGAALVPKKSHDFLGMVLTHDYGRRGRVTRLYRDAISPSIDRAELDLGGESQRVKLTSRCLVPEVRRTIATDERLSGASEIRLDGNQLWVANGKAIYRLPKSGGGIQETLTLPETVQQFEPSPKGVLVLGTLGESIERWNGGKSEKIADGSVFALDGETIWIGKFAGLYELDGETLTEVAPTRGVSGISVTEKAIYWQSNTEIFERDKATKMIRKVADASGVESFVVVGDWLAFVGINVGPWLTPLNGGDAQTLTGGSFNKGRVQTDGTTAYFGLDSRGSRGGVAGVVPGRRSATTDRRYGIDTGTAQAFTVAEGQILWVAETSIYTEPIVPQ